MKNLLLKVLGTCVLAFSATAHAGVIHEVSGGKLVRASGIAIKGELYSVTFGASCSSTYSGCKSSLFDFNTQNDAVTALNALFDQVFVDNVMIGNVRYDFDSRPELVKGCTLAGFCEIWVPYQQVSANTVRSAWHVNTNSVDYVGDNAYVSTYTYGNGAGYMVFTNFEKMAAVPEPTSLALLGLGLAGFGFSRRKKAA